MSDLGLRPPGRTVSPSFRPTRRIWSGIATEAYSIQVSALVQRLRSTGIGRVVIGVSGGLDSTQALIVAAKAFDLLERPRSDILAYTLPGFATGDTTRRSA